MKQNAGVLASNLYFIAILWRISKSRVILSLIMRLLDYGKWVFTTVVFMKYLFGSVDNNKSLAEVLAFLWISMAVWLAYALFGSWYQRRFCAKNDLLLHQELNRMLFDKACNVDISCYEDSEFYNTYTIASKEVMKRAVSSLEDMWGVVGAALSSGYVIYVMFTISPVVGVAAVVPVAVNILMGKRERKVKYEKYVDASPFVRRQDYVNRALYLQAYAKEVRLTEAPGVLGRMYGEATKRLLDITRRYWKRLVVLDGIKGTVIFPVFFEGTWLLGAYLAMVAKTISVSDFVVLANSAVSITWMLLNASDSLVNVIDNGFYITKLRTFLDYKEKIPENQTGLPAPKEDLTLELRGVSFRYKEAFVLKNINITIKSGELVSLVGYNGSGKSTLVKLIMRLYDPTEGVILLNGTDIREYNLREYRGAIGTVFQDFQVFAMSVRDNILADNGGGEETMREAIRLSGFEERAAALRNGEQSMLTREFDNEGEVLSGGETQKVAIARAFAKDGGIYLLDEPSSALDPLTEYRIYESFIRLCKKGRKRIGVLISHRLSSANLTDRIYFLEHGEITESGTHRDLMRLGGAYARMYNKQAESYLAEGCNV